MTPIIGAAPDTGNQGVSALCQSAVEGLTRRGIRDIAIADHGIGRRVDAEGRTRIGLSHTRRIWRGDCLRTVSVLAPMGGGFSPTARVIAKSRAILDVSGGDSFTDLYGPKRFGAMTLSKRTALRCGVPLILLPQTLGPFNDERTRKVAQDILRRATGVWVRDAQSEQVLRDILGAGFDPRRHQRGPDMAVLLPKRAPLGLDATLQSWLSADRGFAVAGLNTSGLLWQQAEAAMHQFGLKSSHQDQLVAIARTVLDSDPNLRLLLVPHVRRPDGDPESDHNAAVGLQARLRDIYGERVAVLPQTLDASELKWVISRLDWFAGARMHATIAGFSSEVPTLGLGYSDKAAGVFAECGIAAQVADLRQLSLAELIARTRASLAERDAMRAQLGALVPDVRARGAAQMDAIAATLAGLPK